MKKILLISCLILSACGTARTVDLGSQQKEIVFEGFTQSPTHHEIRSVMETLSMKECPDGFKVSNQSFSVSPRRTVWKIKCNLPNERN